MQCTAEDTQMVIHDLVFVLQSTMLSRSPLSSYVYTAGLCCASVTAVNSQAQRNTVQLCACIILRLSKLPISIMPGVAADNVAAGADNVLSNASILRHIIDFPKKGFGNWLPVAAVNSSWHKAYKATIRRSVYIQELFLSCDSSS
eukprot:3926-Heterococcus_DN1.PRE.1